MIATNEAVDVLRHGWQDAATALAGDVPEVAELLQARLEMAISTGRLDELHLLDTIEEVESVTSRAGSVSGQALARRLRRTVYEYLLALDAARPLEIARANIDQPVSTQGSPMVGAEEVAALGHASRTTAGDMTDGDESSGPDEAEAALDIQAGDDGLATGDAVEAGGAMDAPATTVGDVDDTTTDVPASRRRFALRRRRHGAENVPGEAEIESPLLPPAIATTEPPETDPAEPNWRFTAAGEPAVFDASLDSTDAIGAAPGDDPTPVGGSASEPAGDLGAGADADTVAEASGEAQAPPAHDSARPYVAPRAGFHIVEDAPAHRDVPEESPLEMPAFSADIEPVSAPTSEDTAGAAARTAAETDPANLGAASPAPAEAGTDFLAWRPPIAADTPNGPVATPAQNVPATGGTPTQQAPATTQPAPIAVPAPVPAETAADQPEADDDDGESRGWGVRKPGEAHSARRATSVVAIRPVEDDPFENNTRLSDMRRRIEERLRRKRCDEAAALLQEVAQETGGRAVAELAMNAGDRCRALGKSNAALNCYLAAARSDPVYELPLSRLADICIDNQDTDLAVSYLERIARIYRYREEDRAALRTYRRIATIAPYREDVLQLLMNAQRTGQLQ